MADITLKLGDINSVTINSDKVPDHLIDTTKALFSALTTAIEGDEVLAKHITTHTESLSKAKEEAEKAAAKAQGHFGHGFGSDGRPRLHSGYKDML